MVQAKTDGATRGKHLGFAGKSLVRSSVIGPALLPGDHCVATAASRSPGVETTFLVPSRFGWDIGKEGEAVPKEGNWGRMK